MKFLNRRSFLKRAAAGTAIAVTAPAIIAKAAEAITASAVTQPTSLPQSGYALRMLDDHETHVRLHAELL